MKKLSILLVIALISLSCQAKKPRTLERIINEGGYVDRNTKDQTVSSQEDIKKPVESRLEKLELPKYETSKKEKKDVPKKEKDIEDIDLKTLIKTTEPILFSAEAMPLSDFIQYTLGDLLKIPYFIDEQVKMMKNPVTFRSTQPMEPQNFLESVLELIKKNGVLYEVKGGTLFLNKDNSSQRKPVEINFGKEVPQTNQNIIQIVPLNHIRPSDAEFFIKSLYPGVKVQPYRNENALIIEGQGNIISDIVNTISVFDIPAFSNKYVYLAKLIYWEPNEFVNQIKSILESLGYTVSKSIKEPGVSFLPLKFSNSVILIAPDEKTLDFVVNWYKKLDNPESAGTETKSFVYRPKFSKATDIVNSLKNLYGVGTTNIQTVAQTSQQPQQQQAKISSGFSFKNISIAADDSRNIILINATPSEYKNLLVFLENLDIPPKQVLLETTIAEITLKDDLQFGLEWFVKNRMKDGVYNLTTLGQLGVPSNIGITYRFLTDSQKFQLLVNALAKENKINILSTPRILVLDNREATIQIGTEVPIVSGEITTALNNAQTPAVSRSIQYRNTGTILRVRPTINTEGFLMLDISQEVSDAQQNTTSGIDSPIILTRRINTSVVVENGQTLVLGGIISETKGSSQTKIPLLGDIPIIGYLFRNTSIGKTKTELVIMITPLIINDTEFASRISDEIRREFKWMKN